MTKILDFENMLGSKRALYEEYYSGKNKKRLETIINIVIAVAAIYYIRWNIWLYPIVYMVSDVLIFIVSCIIFNVHYFFSSKVLNKEKREQRMELLIEKLEKLKRKYEINSNSYWEEDRDNAERVKKEIDFYEKELNFHKNAMKKYEEEVNSVVKEIKTECDIFEESVTQTFQNINSISFNEDDNDIVEKLQLIQTSVYKLICEAEKKPDSTRSLSRLITVYLPQVERLMIQYSNIENNKRPEYKEKITVLTENMLSYVDKVYEELRDYNLEDIEVTIGLLNKELKGKNANFKEVTNNLPKAEDEA